MKTKLYHWYCVLYTLPAALLPLGLRAAEESGSGSGGPPPDGINYRVSSRLLPEIDSLEDLLVALLQIFITIATPIVVLFIILAGFKYVTARGNAQQVADATRALTYAVIGGLLILGAVAISVMISNVVGSLTT